MNCDLTILALLYKRHDILNTLSFRSTLNNSRRCVCNFSGFKKLFSVNGQTDTECKWNSFAFYSQLPAYFSSLGIFKAVLGCMAWALRRSHQGFNILFVLGRKRKTIISAIMHQWTQSSSYVGFLFLRGLFSLFRVSLFFERNWTEKVRKFLLMQKTGRFNFIHHSFVCLSVCLSISLSHSFSFCLLFNSDFSLTFFSLSLILFLSHSSSRYVWSHIWPLTFFTLILARSLSFPHTFSLFLYLLFLSFSISLSLSVAPSVSSFCNNIHSHHRYCFLSFRIRLLSPSCSIAAINSYFI